MFGQRGGHRWAQVVLVPLVSGRRGEEQDVCSVLAEDCGGTGSCMLGTNRSGKGRTTSPPSKSPPPGFPGGENGTWMCCGGDLT